MTNCAENKDQKPDNAKREEVFSSLEQYMGIYSRGCNLNCVKACS